MRDWRMDFVAAVVNRRQSRLRSAVHLFSEKFLLVEPNPFETPICRDHYDDVVLATALAGECAAIVSGDQDLLILDPFRGIRVLVPSAFWQWEAGQCS